MDTLNTYLESILDKKNKNNVGASIEDSAPFKFLKEYEYLHPALLVNFYNEYEGRWQTDDTINTYADGMESGKVFFKMMHELKEQYGSTRFIIGNEVDFVADDSKYHEYAYNLSKKLFKEKKWYKKLTLDQEFVLQTFFNIRDFSVINSCEKFMMFYDDDMACDGIYVCNIVTIPKNISSDYKKLLEIFCDECAKR